METEQAPTLSHRKALAYSCGQLAAGLFYAFNNFTLPIYLSLYTNNAILIGLAQQYALLRAGHLPAAGGGVERPHLDAHRQARRPSSWPACPSPRFSCWLPA